MSAKAQPTRAPRRRPQPQAWKPTRDKREVWITVAVVAGIVVGTALLIWMLRPSPSVPMENNGGWLARQARIGWFILALGLIALIVWGILRSYARALAAIPRLAVTIVITAVFGFVLGFFWPGGLINPGVIEVPDAPGPQPNPGPLPGSKDPFPTALTTAPTETTAPTG